MTEQDVTGMVHTIAKRAGIANENIVRKAAFALADEQKYNRYTMLERIYLNPANEELQASFQAKITELDAKAWDADMRDMQRIRDEWREYRDG